MRLCGYGNPNIVFAGSNRPLADAHKRPLPANSGRSQLADNGQKQSFTGGSYRRIAYPVPGAAHGQNRALLYVRGSGHDSTQGGARLLAKEARKITFCYQEIVFLRVGGKKPQLTAMAVLSIRLQRCPHVLTV